MTIDTIDTAKTIERGLAFINKLVTPGGSPRSTGDKVKEESSGLNLKGVWNAINGVASEDHASYAIELLKEDGLAANLAGAYFMEGERGVQKLLSMHTTRPTIDVIVSCLPLTSIEDLIASLKAKKVDVVSTVAGQPLNSDFGDALEEYIRDSMSVSRFDIPLGDIEKCTDNLSRVYDLVGKAVVQEYRLKEASHLLQSINPNIRIGDSGGHALRCHADRLSAALWLRTGEVVPAAHAMLARKVYILASSMGVEKDLGEAILLHCILVENVASVFESAEDPSSMVGLVPSLLTTENLMNAVAARHGDYKYILPLLNKRYGLFGAEEEEDLVGILIETRDSLNRVLTALRTEGFDGTTIPVRKGGATVATSPTSVKPPVGALADALKELESEGDTRRGTPGALF